MHDLGSTDRYNERTIALFMMETRNDKIEGKKGARQTYGFRRAALGLVRKGEGSSDFLFERRCTLVGAVSTQSTLNIWYNVGDVANATKTPTRTCPPFDFV